MKLCSPKIRDLIMKTLWSSRRNVIQFCSCFLKENFSIYFTTKNKALHKYVFYLTSTRNNLALLTSALLSWNTVNRDNIRITCETRDSMRVHAFIKDHTLLRRITRWSVVSVFNVYKKNHTLHRRIARWSLARVFKMYQKNHTWVRRIARWSVVRVFNVYKKNHTWVRRIARWFNVTYVNLTNHFILIRITSCFDVINVIRRKPTHVKIWL